MTSPSSTIVIEDDELPPSWRSANLQVQRTSPRTSPEILIEPNDAASGSIEPSRKRKRAKRKQPDTLDTYFKKLRKTFDQRDQEVENLEQEVEKQQKQVQELQSKLLLQEDRHQEELSRRRILDCKICYEQPDSVSDPEPLNFENVSQPQNIVGADEVVSTSFADEMHWETERQFLEFGLDESDPVDLAGQHSQSVDLGIPTQNGELPNFETIDPAILNGHASPVVEQAQRTMSIAGITTHPEECPAEG
ncbi:hypothetical protein E8E15_000801 [Penicillium rubens]|nr:hypothetical protein E8E15_000801 [Penicillium rubens]